MFPKSGNVDSNDGSKWLSQPGAIEGYAIVKMDHIHKDAVKNAEIRSLENYYLDSLKRCQKT